MSAILSADDLNDFISPGVACIKPVETLPKETATSYEVTLEDQAAPQEPGAAQISLTDCLACSGCVTSAEVVLVSLQSHNEVLRALDAEIMLPADSISPNLPAEGMIYVASVSPQTRASFAATLGVSEQEGGYLIEQILGGPQGLKSGGKHGNGFKWIIDTNVAREACLVLGAEEVIDSLSPSRRPSPSLPPPILTSSCPGWICYVEKTHPYILPHLSRLKSPQALLGTLIKSSLSKIYQIPPDRIWHVAVMPCFDKKLEASREELTDSRWASSSQGTPGKAVRDVDCVITTRELFTLAESRNINISSLPRRPIERQAFPDPRLDHFLFPSHRPNKSLQSPYTESTSGGYLDYILASISQMHPGSRISAQPGRNADVGELQVLSTSNTVLFRAARYYGFRNIQNLVRRLQPPSLSKMPGARKTIVRRRQAGEEYAYVEVMACPGGCTNGGGQVKAAEVPVLRGEEGQWGTKEWLQLVDEAYFSDEDTRAEESSAENLEGKEVCINGILPAHIKSVLRYWEDLVEVGLEQLAYTSYRAVESDVGKDKKSETARVVELAGKIGGGW
ncbi:MAG: Cytosolic Fe-S cluster assembly factor nar1 [Trizodia sp. TS-e1964]|nr:MAG: Cytosolic Fe-S cluster assembly factor nar1 [Trizodia sp. TS-e1964]